MAEEIAEFEDVVSDVDYKKIIELQESKIKTLEAKIAEQNRTLEFYEVRGDVALYYSFNRKQNEMAKMLNDVCLYDIDLTDPKDKQFDRIFKLLEKSEIITNTVRSIKAASNISGDENEDMKRRPYNDTIAVKRD